MVVVFVQQTLAIDGVEGGELRRGCHQGECVKIVAG